MNIIIFIIAYTLIIQKKIKHNHYMTTEELRYIQLWLTLNMNSYKSIKHANYVSFGYSN